MVGCIWLAFYGYQILHIWVFLGGFVSAGFFIYTVSPFIFDGEICCGSGADAEAQTERARLMASVGVGLVAGALAIYALKVGVFLSGTCFGLGLALSTRTVLAHLHVFQTGASFATFYLISALVGGLLAVYKEQPIIILATSFGGCFGFFICVGHFQHCPFIDTITHVEEAVESHSKSPDNLPECAKVEGVLFVAMFVLSALFQYGCLCSKSDGRCGSSGGSGGGSGAGGMGEWAVMEDYGYAEDDDYYDDANDGAAGKVDSNRRRQKERGGGGGGGGGGRNSRMTMLRPKRNRSGNNPRDRGRGPRGARKGGGRDVARGASSDDGARPKHSPLSRGGGGGRKGGYTRVAATAAWSSSDDGEQSDSPLRPRSHARRARASRTHRTTSFR